MKEQFSAIEEARADLVALYFLPDPKLVELGLIPEQHHDEIVRDPLDPKTEMGAQVSSKQLATILGYIESGKQEGATVAAGGERDRDGAKARGNFLKPTVFTDVAQSHRIARDEIFGPVLSVLTFRTPDEAIAKANNTPYGLSAGVWTEKGSRILAVADKLRAGGVWANTFNRFGPSSPFGGYKESGYGREGGRHGLAAYLKGAAAAGAAARVEAGRAKKEVSA